MTTALGAGKLLARRAGQTAVPIREQQQRIAMHAPVALQQAMGCLGQGHEAIAVALGIAHMHPSAHRIDIAHLKPQAFAQAKAQAVEGEEENPVARHAGGGEQLLGLLDGDDVGEALDLGRLDQRGRHAGFAQDMGVVELPLVGGLASTINLLP